MFEFKKCDIDGLFEIQPEIFKDSRGSFTEIYNEKAFHDAGLTMHFVQENQSASSKDVLRGLHFQKAHPQGKLVWAVCGTVYDVVVDLRNDSPSFGKYHSVLLDGCRHNELYVPEGFAHGYYVLSDSAVFAYKCTDFYDPLGEGGVRYNDQTLAINWSNGTADFNPIVNERDNSFPLFNPCEYYFDLNGHWIGA